MAAFPLIPRWQHPSQQGVRFSRLQTKRTVCLSKTVVRVRAIRRIAERAFLQVVRAPALRYYKLDFCYCRHTASAGLTTTHIVFYPQCIVCQNDRFGFVSFLALRWEIFLACPVERRVFRDSQFPWVEGLVKISDKLRILGRVGRRFFSSPG